MALTSLRARAHQSLLAVCARDQLQTMVKGKPDSGGHLFIYFLYGERTNGPLVGPKSLPEIGH
jgi:hypothetical protein